MTEEMEKLNSFMDELTEISKKYKLYIDGCGCCGSPFIIDGKANVLEYEIGFIKSKNRYCGLSRD